MKRLLGLPLAITLGCSSSPSDPAPKPQPEPSPVVPQLGDGSAVLTPIYEAGSGREATALAFNPARPDELWVLLREPYEGLPCTQKEKQGCAALGGRVAIVRGAGGSEPTAELKTDPNAWHFMRRPIALAFGAGETFATCGEFWTANFEDGAAEYIGPTLWSSDPEIFARSQPPPQDGSFEPNGSHLDMLHETPFCMGIAHERDNVYWTFNGKLGAIDRYDFKQPHPPGADDHSDGELLRWVEGELLRVDDTPSHMAYDPDSARLLVADSGNGRVVALDTTSGTPGEELPTYDAIAVHQRIDGASLTELVPPGVVGLPSGLALAGGTLFVGDRATGILHAFDLQGALLGSLDTGVGPDTLAGITVGPDDRLYFVDQYAGRVVRIDVP
jgi:hypothetical protein